MLRVTISINLLAMVKSGRNATENNATHHSSSECVRESNSSSGLGDGPKQLADVRSILGDKNLSNFYNNFHISTDLDMIGIEQNKVWS